MNPELVSEMVETIFVPMFPEIGAGILLILSLLLLYIFARQSIR